jgi:hypothetical protein
MVVALVLVVKVVQTQIVMVARVVEVTTTLPLVQEMLIKVLLAQIAITPILKLEVAVVVGRVVLE